MAVYFITGKLGAGKTLCAVGRIRDYLETGRKVATNLDLKLENMFPETSKQTAIRLPDKPRLSDLEMLGRGCEVENESKYGLIVLDELGTWFNSRNWRDPERLALIDWCLHARKHHWDIFFIVQSIDSLDGQLVNALCEHLVICKRTDRLSLPLIGGLLRSMGFEKTMPKVHVANVLYGQTESSPRVMRWVYRGKDLYNSYNTAQVFTDQNEIINDEIVDFRASFSFLSSYHINAVAYKNHLFSKIKKLSPQKSRTTLPALGGIFTGSRLSPAPLLIVAVMAFSLIYLFNKNDPLQASEKVVFPKDVVKSVEIKEPGSYEFIDHSVNFVDRLLTVYKPRLAALVSDSRTQEKYVLIQFYNGSKMVEQLDIESLHHLGIGVVIKPYGVDLITGTNSYPVTSWAIGNKKIIKEKS